MVLHATLKNISVISVLLVVEAKSTWRKPLTCRKLMKNYHIILYRVHIVWTGFELTTLVLIGSDCIVSYKSNYHTITTTSAPITLGTNHLTFREAIFFLPSQNFSFYLKQTSDVIYMKKFVNIVPILPKFFVESCMVTLYISASFRIIYVCL